MNINNYGTIYIVNTPPPEASAYPSDGGVRTPQVIPYSQRALGDDAATRFDANAFGRSAASLLSAASVAKKAASGDVWNRAAAYLRGPSLAATAFSGAGEALNRATAYSRGPYVAESAFSDAGAAMASLLRTPPAARAMASSAVALSEGVASLLSAPPPSQAFANTLGPAAQAISAEHFEPTTSTQTLPHYWDPDKTYKPGDQVIYNGNIYQAPNQGGIHHAVQPGTDDSKWLYAGTFQNYSEQILSQDKAHNAAVLRGQSLANAVGPATQALWTQVREPTTLPQYWSPEKIYKPGDQVVYNGNVYQAPNQGGYHYDVEPGSDDSKWLYAGTFKNHCKQIFSEDAAHDNPDKLQSADVLMSSII